jgi:hypothetical protein
VTCKVASHDVKMENSFSWEASWLSLNECVHHRQIPTNCHRVECSQKFSVTARKISKATAKQIADYLQKRIKNAFWSSKKIYGGSGDYELPGTLLLSRFQMNHARLTSF